MDDAPCRYLLDLTAIGDGDLKGSLASATGFRRDFQGRLELLAAVDAALDERSRTARPTDSEPGKTP